MKINETVDRKTVGLQDLSEEEMRSTMGGLLFLRAGGTRDRIEEDCDIWDFAGPDVSGGPA